MLIKNVNIVLEDRIIENGYIEFHITDCETSALCVFQEKNDFPQKFILGVRQTAPFDQHFS